MAARLRTRILAGTVVIAVALGSGTLVQPASAAVSWSAWAETSFQEEVDRAAEERRLLILVVTQPDWCPPCIRLNHRWLENPEEQVVADATRGAVLLEVLGYDADGAALLREQRIRFQGTPTTHVYRPTRAGQLLSRAEHLGSIVGAPDDYAERLVAIVSGRDAVAGLREDVREAADETRRAELRLELADRLIARGDDAEAERVLRQVERRARRGAEGSELAALGRRASWRRAAVVDLRVRKDYPAALAGIDAHVKRHGRPDDEREAIGYARAWALAHLDREDEALAELRATYLQPRTRDGIATFAYFAFRVRSERLMTLAEREVQGLLRDRPDDAVLHQALGRLHRRQGRLHDALDAFARAVELAPDDAARVVYRGQWRHVRDELGLP